MVCAVTSIICTLQADTLDFNLLVLPRTLFVVGNQRAANEIENSRAKKKKNTDCSFGGNESAVPAGNDDVMHTVRIIQH